MYPVALPCTAYNLVLTREQECPLSQRYQPAAFVVSVYDSEVVVFFTDIVALGINCPYVLSLATPPIAIPEIEGEVGSSAMFRLIAVADSGVKV